MSTSTWPRRASSSKVSTVASDRSGHPLHASNVTDTPSHRRVSRPRNSEPFAISIVRCSSPAAHPRERVGEPRDRRRDVALRRREPRHPVCAREPGDVLARELAAHDAEPGEHPVVAVGDVAAALRLGDLRVVDLGRVPADVADLRRRARRAARRPGPRAAPGERCRPRPASGRRRPCARPDRSTRRPGSSRIADAGEHVLEDRDSPPSARPRTSCRACASEPPATTSDRSSMPASISAAATTIACTGAAQNDFTSIAARAREPARLGDRLREVAAAALVPVADRLLAAPDRVRDRRRIDAGPREQVAQRVHAARLDREVLQQHVARRATRPTRASGANAPTTRSPSNSGSWPGAGSHAESDQVEPVDVEPAAR